MMQLDKTFPTLDCSACILTPKMSDVGNHPNIELLTYSEITEVKGYVGNFKVTIKKKPRYILEDKCNGCGNCISYCPVEMPDPFNLNLSQTKCLYIPFPQAVPACFVIDPDYCRYTLKRECKQCEPVCKDLAAIDLKQKEQFIDVEVGTIIVATGFDTFDPTLKPELGYGLYPNVITGLEFERLSSASGPTTGEVIINGKKTKNVVFIHCVGSRDKSVGNEYCSRVCCMYTAKQAHLIKEKIPDAKVTVFYIDVRAFGKGFEEFYDRVKQEGIIYIRGNVSEVYKRGEKLIVKAEDTLLGQLIEVETDLVVLAVGMVPRTDSNVVTNLLKLSQSSDKFLLEAHPKLRPVDTASDGIFLAGCCQGPKDIPDTVAQASAAAAKACIPLSQGKVKTEAQVSQVDESLCRGCSFCIEACPYEAIELKSIERAGQTLEVASVNEVLCKGCGACAAACLSGAIQQKSFTDEQLLSMIASLGEYYE
jgi:heterodisulfide reductase subunit A